MEIRTWRGPSWVAAAANRAAAAAKSRRKSLRRYLRCGTRFACCANRRGLD
jgi:hypothetical protein